MRKIFIMLLGLTFISAACDRVPANTSQEVESQEAANEKEVEQTYQTVEFAAISPLFRFTSQIPSNWQVEYVAETEALNLYDPNEPGASTLEKSQIFIRHFTASSFLTLSSVDILAKEATAVGDHLAVKYEIRKKSNVADFANQPKWRSGQHKLTDIRFSANSPSIFYVFAYNPNLDQTVFDRFISDLIFHNQKKSFKQPIDQAEQRITKKPFGIKISPQASPVQPEKFFGYHTGVDYEIFSGEEDKEISVLAVCGGKLLRVESATGYGGVAVQACEIENQKVTVIYGHIDRGSVSHRVGDYLVPGQQLAYLGDGLSDETDGERKHLHLGVHQGGDIDTRGYASNLSEIENWIDFQAIMR